MKARIAFAVGALGIALSPFAVAQTEDAPPPATKTEAALACLLGMGPQGCQMIFEQSESAAARTTYCAEQYVHRWLDNCFPGPLETVEYLGTNAAKDDVYLVKNMHAETTYVISPPAPDGKIQGVWITAGPPPTRYFPSSWFAVTSPANRAQPLYTRPQQEN